MAGINITKDNKILFSYKFDPGIFSFDMNAWNLSHISTGMTPCWSPDNSKIAFQHWTALVFGDEHAQNLKLIDEFGKDPCWSPNGNQIAYTHQPNFDERPVIKIVNFANNNTSTLSKGESPAWSSDGKRLAFWNRGGIEIYNFEDNTTISLDDQIKDVSSDDNYGFARDLIWSPNNNKFLYVGYHNRLNMIDLEEMTRIQIKGINPWAIGWFPDNERFSFVGWLKDESQLTDQPALYTYDLKSQKERRIMYVMH